MAGFFRTGPNGRRHASGVALLLVTAFAWSAASPAAWAQRAFYFSAKPVFALEESYQDSIEFRPNTALPLYVFVRAPRQMANAYVELWAPGDREKPWARSAPLKFESEGQTLRVTFPKAEEKKPAKPAEPPVAPAANVPPPPPPPPPGRQLFAKPTGGAAGGFRFDLKLIEVVDNKPRDVLQESVAVAVLSPDRYLNVDASSRGNNLTVTVSAKGSDDATTRKAFLDGSASVVSLAIPQQDHLDVRALGSGTYRKSIAAPGKSVTLESNNLPIVSRGERGAVRFYIHADGYTRAFVYQPRLSEIGTGSLQPSSDSAIRVYPGDVVAESFDDMFYARPGAKPEDRYPVRIELDNAPANAETKVTFYRSGDTNRDEVGTFYGPRDTRIWVEPAGEEGQFVVTNKLTDWVAPLETYMLRGMYRVNAALGGASAPKDVGLLLDDTAPSRISLQLPDEHIKGTAMHVAADVVDREGTPIRRVVFFIGLPPGPDGKRAADPLKVEGLRDPADKNLWHAQLPLAPDAKGVLEVGATAINEVGLDGTETKNIKLVDAPAPAGDIAVTVVRGSRPQPGVNVLLRDAEGKDKSVLTTNAKGQVKFEKLAPGLYSVLAGKPDSSSGSKAATPVKVDIGKTTDVTLSLKRGP